MNANCVKNTELPKSGLSLDWNFKKMAKDIGREVEYDAIYKPLSELVHSSNLGISLRSVKAPGSDWPALSLGASDQFCDFSLYSGHKFLMQILEAFNHCLVCILRYPISKRHGSDSESIRSRVPLCLSALVVLHHAWQDDRGEYRI